MNTNYMQLPHIAVPPAFQEIFTFVAALSIIFAVAVPVVMLLLAQFSARYKSLARS